MKVLGLSSQSRARIPDVILSSYEPEQALRALESVVDSGFMDETNRKAINQALMEYMGKNLSEKDSKHLIQISRILGKIKG